MDNAAKCIVNVRPPFGYRKGEDGRFAIDEKTAPIVDEIFNRVLEGWSYADIAEDLNRRGIKTAYGREWNKGSFHAMIKNDMYTGVYKYSSIRIEGGVDLTGGCCWRFPAIYPVLRIPRLHISKVPPPLQPF